MGEFFRWSGTGRATIATAGAGFCGERGWCLAEQPADFETLLRDPGNSRRPEDIELIVYQATRREIARFPLLLKMKLHSIPPMGLDRGRPRSTRPLMSFGVKPPSSSSAQNGGFVLWLEVFSCEKNYFLSERAKRRSQTRSSPNESAVTLPEESRTKCAEAPDGVANVSRNVGRRGASAPEPIR